MTENKILNNYLIFKKLQVDSIGINYRGAEIKDNKPGQHKIITEVNPVYTENDQTWKRMTLLLEGVKKSNIVHLFSPDKIVKSNQATLLIYPYIKGVTLEEIMDEADKKDIAINFDLAFSMITAIADLIDIGSSIVVSGKKSFHGFLTPDNIIVDYDGNIYLKNYGIQPYLDRNETIYREMEMKYGAWLSPEFQKREKIVPQSDIYHLGYIIYRILTGQYFSYSPGEDFDAKFSSISFKHFMPTEKDDLTNLISFFKKTLHPDPQKRFANVRELKDFVSNYFRIDELSSVTFSLAYFMNSLYSEEMEAEEKILAEELAYQIPVAKGDEGRKSAEERARDNEIVEKILTGLEETERSKSRLLAPMIALLLIVIGVAGYLYINQANKAKQEQIKIQQELERKLAQIQQQTQKEYQDKLKNLETKYTETEEEQKKKEEEIKKLKEWRKEQEVKEQERLTAIESAKKLEELEAEKKRLEEEKKRLAADAEKRRLAEEQLKKQEAEEQLKAEKEKPAKPGELIDIEFATQKPVRISGEEPDFPRNIKKNFKGTQMKVIASLLIDDRGNVARVKFKGNVAPEIKMSLAPTLASWKYKPAMKDAVKVKVWYDVPINLEF